MTNTITVTERAGKTAVTPDYTFDEPLVSKLTGAGLPTTAQGIMDVIDQMRNHKPEFAFWTQSSAEGIVVTVPSVLCGAVEGQGKRVCEAYADAILNSISADQRQAAVLRAGFEAGQVFDREHHGE